MGHIHTEPGQHDYTVGAYIIRDDGNEPRLIMHMHKKLNTLLAFGGHIELDETPWQAVIHEIREESGYDIGQLKILQPKERLKKLSGTVSDPDIEMERWVGSVLHPYPVVIDTHVIRPGHFHTNATFAFVTDQNPNNNVDDGESNDIRLFSRSEIVDLTDEQVPAPVRETALFVFDVCLPKWERVGTGLYK